MNTLPALYVIVAAMLALGGAVPPRDVVLPTMNNGNLWVTSGSITFSNGTLRLNDDQSFQGNTAFFGQKVWLDQWNFTVLWTLTPGASSNNGGFAIVFQSDRLGQPGPNDAGIGYGSIPQNNGGIAKSIAIEFDTVNDQGVDDTVSDCSPPHVSVHSVGNGAANSAIEKGARVGCWNSMSDPYSNPAYVHNLTLSYKSSMLHVRYDDVVSVAINVSIDLVSALGLTDSEAWMGFTASTGAQGGDVHTVLGVWYHYQSELAVGKSVQYGLITAPAGGLQTIVVAAVDQYGHPYPFGGANITMAMQKATSHTQFNFLATDLQNGNYSVAWSSTLAVQDSLTISINGAPISGSPFTVTVTPLDVDAALCNTTGEGVTYAEAGIPASFNVNVFDMYNNPTNHTADFTGTTCVGANGTNANVTIPAPVSTGFGVYTFTFIARSVGEYVWNIVVNGKAIGYGPPPLHVAHGPPDAEKCNVTGLAATFVVGTQQNFVLTLVDGEGNLYSGPNTSVSFVMKTIDSHNPPVTVPVTGVPDNQGHVNCTFLVQIAGTWQLTITILGKTVSKGVPQQIVATPGPASAAHSLIGSYNGSVWNYPAGTNITTTLVVNDLYDNPVADQTIAWTVTINGQAYKPSYVASSVGVWQVQWQPTAAGLYVMAAAIGGQAIEYSGKFQVQVSALHTPDVGKTQVSGVGATDAHVGRLAVFWVVVKDLFGNTIGIPADANVSCTIVRDVAAPGAGDNISTTVAYVASNTTWTVSYTPTSAGRFKLRLRVGTGIYQGGAALINVVSDDGLGGGAIAAIVLSCLGAVALLIGLGFLYRRRKKKYQSI